MKQDKSRLRLPLQRGAPSQSIAGAPEEAKGEAGKRPSEETTGEVVPVALSSEEPPVPGMGELLVTHKRITVIVLTLTLELLLKDGNRSRRLIENAPDFS